jgi:hypothetical protein
MDEYVRLAIALFNKAEALRGVKELHGARIGSSIHDDFPFKSTEDGDAWLSQTPEKREFETGRSSERSARNKVHQQVRQSLYTPKLAGLQGARPIDAVAHYSRHIPDIRQLIKKFVRFHKDGGAGDAFSWLTGPVGTTLISTPSLSDPRDFSRYTILDSFTFKLAALSG